MRRVLLLALAASLLTVGPAVAEPPLPIDVPEKPLAVVGVSDVRFRYDAGTDIVEIHLDGDVSGGTRVVGSWRLVVAGARGDVPYTYTWESAAFTVTDHVVSIRRVAPSGELVVRWGYLAAGAYMTTEQAHVFLWTPQTDNRTAGAGISG